MKIVDREIRDLIPAEYNPRHLSQEQAEHLEASLKRFGAVDPAIINIHPDRKNIIIGGHQRLKTAQRLGWETFPCVELELDKEKERELNIRLNKNTGGWDYDALANYFEVEELTEWGFSDEELFGDIEAEEVEAEEDNYEEPEDIKVDVVLGDLIEIGEHRLFCGDSTDSDQVAKLMNGEKADMVFTDPPYNLQERGQMKRTNKTESKREDFGDWDIKFNPLDVLPNIYLFTAENANIYICTSNYLFGEIHNELEKMDLKPNYVVWCKNNPMPSLSKNRFVQATELIIHGIKGKPTFNYPKGENLPNYFNGNVEPHEFGHPTQKPIYVVEHFINKENGSILDLFMGSGSTMVASHQLKRKCYGMELDPKYCQVIIDRMKKLDDTLDIKINGEPYGL